MQFCTGFFLLLGFFVGVAKTRRPESTTAKTDISELYRILQGFVQLEPKKADNVPDDLEIIGRREDIDAKYKWLPRQNFYRQQYLVHDSSRKEVDCYSGTIYSDYTSGQPLSRKIGFLRYKYYKDDSMHMYNDTCTATLLFTDRQLNMNSTFLIHFGPQNGYPIADFAQSDWEVKWGAFDGMSHTFTCDAYNSLEREPCNSIDWLLGSELKMSITNWDSYGRSVSDGIHYTTFNTNNLMFRRALWKLVYPDSPDLDGDLYETILHNHKDVSSNVPRTIRTRKEKAKIPNRLLLSEDTIDEKLGNIGTIAVICIVCLYVIMFRIAYQWIIKGNQMEEAHNIA